MFEATTKWRHAGAAPRHVAQKGTDSRPTVSLIWLTADDPVTAARAAAAQSASMKPLDVEVIVVRRDTQAAHPAVMPVGRSASVIHGPAAASDAELRAIGFAVSSGDLVVLVDDLARVDHSWLKGLRSWSRVDGAGA